MTAHGRKGDTAVRRGTVVLRLALGGTMVLWEDSQLVPEEICEGVVTIILPFVFL